MSKHNDIYNILGKLDSLTPKAETPKTVEKKSIYESVDAKGSVLEGVSKVEAKLAKQFAESKVDETFGAKLRKYVPGFAQAQLAGKIAKSEWDGIDKNDDETDQAYNRRMTASQRYRNLANGDDLDEDMLAKKDYDGDGEVESGKDEYMGSKDKAIKKAMGKKDLDEETHGQYLAQKEKEAQSSGKSSFQAFKQTHSVDGKPGVEEEAEEETLEEGFADLEKYMADKKGTGKFDKKKTSTGTTYTRKSDTFSDDNTEKTKDTSDGPKKKGRPKKDKFAESVWKAYSKYKLKEGVNFTEMMQETNGHVEEMLAELSQDIHEFKRSGRMSDKLRDCLEMHRYSKKALEEAEAAAAPAEPITPDSAPPAPPGLEDKLKALAGPTPAPAAPAAAPAPGAAPVAESGAFHPGRVVYWRGKEGEVDRVEGNKCFVVKPNGEMDVWPTRECSTEKQGMLDTLGGDIKGMGQGIKNFVMNKPDPLDEELNELAKLAGLSEAKKCNHTIEGKKCPVHGLKECGGGMYEAKGKPDYLDFDKDGDKKEPMKKALKDKEKVDECGPGTMSPMSNMGQDEGNMSINTSMNSDGTKSVSVNATGNQADALAQMLKMAGLAAHHAVHGGDEPKGIIIQAGPEEQVEEERTGQYANTPDEEVENVDAIMHQGDDLHKEKEQYAGMPKAGDNPMATRESIEMPARISRMLEGVKLVDAK